MRAEGVPFERLDAAEVMRRWPAWRLGDEHIGLFQADAGLADPSRGNAAHRELARAHGATLRDRTRGRRASRPRRRRGRASSSRTGSGSPRAQVILADRRVDQRPARAARRPAAADGHPGAGELVHAARRPGAVRAGAVPGLDLDGRAELLRLPDLRPPGGPKIGQDVGGREVTNATRTFDRDEDAHARVMAFLEAHLPGMAGRAVPDQDLPVHADAGPGLRGRRAARAPAACTSLLGSAHAYKFASVLGRILVELALDGSSPSEPELGGFRIDRPILREREPRAGLRPLSALNPSRCRGHRIGRRSCEPSGAVCHSSARPPPARRRDGPPRRRGGRQPARGGDPDAPAPSATRATRSIGRARCSRSAVLLPAAGASPPRREPVVLRVGHDAGPRRANPFNTTLVVGYEAFQLTYNLLVDFDKDAHPAAGLRRQLGAIATTASRSTSGTG